MNPEELSKIFEATAEYEAKRRKLIEKAEQIQTNARKLVHEFVDFFFNFYGHDDCKKLPVIGKNKARLAIVVKKGAEDPDLGPGSITALMSPIGEHTYLNTDSSYARSSIAPSPHTTRAFSMGYEFWPDDPTTEAYPITHELFRSTPLERKETAGGPRYIVSKKWAGLKHGADLAALESLVGKMQEEIGEAMIATGEETLRILKAAVADKELNIQFAAVLLSRQARQARGELPTEVVAATIE